VKVDKDNYLSISVNTKSVRIHRFVMMWKMHRLLEPWEQVHHKNGNKQDNQIENLVLVLHSHHHGNVRCPHCLSSFLIR